MGDQIKLGDKVKHRINGLTGIVTARVEYLAGEDRFLVTPEDPAVDDRWVNGGEVEPAE